MLGDARFALRMIINRRWFSLAVVATIALGIGVNTMVFTLTNAVFLKPIAVHGGDRLVLVTLSNPKDPTRGALFSEPEFREFRAHNGSFEGIEGAYQDRVFLTEEDNAPQPFSVQRVTPGLFDMLEIPPILGRGFTAADGQLGAPAVVLLGHAAWHERYGGSPKIIGRSVRISGQLATIVGVMPPGFKFPLDTELWMSLIPPADVQERMLPRMQLYGILNPGVSITSAQKEMGILHTRWAARSAHPEFWKGLTPHLQTLQDRQIGPQVRQLFWLMQMAVIFVLLIACANNSNMMFCRGLERRQELAIRAAMGASPWQIVRQLLIESILLSVVGGLAGLGFALWGVRLFDLATQAVVGKPYWIVFTMDYTAFGYFAALCIGCGLLFGLSPALRASRLDLNTALSEGSRTAGHRRGGVVSGGLIVVQFTLTLVLLSGAGMFVRGVLNLQTIDKRIPVDRLLGARLWLPPNRYPDVEARHRFFDLVLLRLRGMPGVAGAALSSTMPGIGGPKETIEIEGQPVSSGQSGPQATSISVSLRLFDAINLPILAGRDFDAEDGLPGRRCAIVTREFAERHWPHQDVIGKRFRLIAGSPGEWLTVIGVSANLVQQNTGLKPPPTIFVPYLQVGLESMILILRSTAATSLVMPARAAVHGIDPDVPLHQVETLALAIEHQQWFLHLFSKLFSVFALIALIIAAVGLYAVMAHDTVRRTREIGIRMALGARPHSILLMVLWRGLWQMLAGITIGLVLSVPGVELMQGLPFDVPTKDAGSFVAVTVILIAVGTAASWLPARRAAALEPLAALHDE